MIYRIIIILALIIVVIVPFALYNFHTKELLTYFKLNLGCLLIWLSMIGGLLIAIFSKEKRKQMGMEIGKENNISDKLKKQLILPETHSEATVDEIKVLANEKKIKELDYILDLISKGQEELVLAETYKELEKTHTEAEEFIYRFILYMAYISLNNDNYLDEIIENNKKFINLIKKFEKKGFYKHTEVQLNLAIAYARKKLFDDMLKENFEVIKEIRKTPKISNEIKRLSYHIQGVYYLNKNNIPYAMGYFEKAAQYDKNNCEILFNMALIYYSTEKNINKCLECISKINRSTINDKQFRLLICIQYYCLSLEKRYDEAYEIIDNYHLSEHDFPINMKADKSYIAYKMNFFDEAKNLTDEVLSIEYNATAMNVRAMLQIKDRLYEEALKNFTKIIPDFSIGKDYEKYYLGEIYYHRSYTHLKLNNVKEAIEDYNRANDLKFIDYAPDYIIELDLAKEKFSEELHND